MNSIFERLRKLQSVIQDNGLGGSLLALPAPKILMLPDATAEENKEELIFDQIVVEEEIIDVCRDLFESGFYNLAVSEAFKALDLFIKDKVKEYELSGTQLIQKVFSVGNPLLVWSDRKTTSEKDQHRGYSLLFQGGFTALRNPTSHELDWISEPDDALDAILIAQHLLRKAKLAVKETI